VAQTQGKRWQKLLQYEHEQRLRLEEMVEQLAKQHSALENRARRSMSNVQRYPSIKQGGDHAESKWIRFSWARSKIISSKM
jgi:hypothetical protein